MTPKALLLQLLSAYADPLEVALLVRAGAVFGFENGAIRVTLSRLQHAGHVASAGRGRWQLTPAAMRLAEQVATWRDLPSRVRPWEGGWIGLATGGLTRKDRSALRRRDRALTLLGFRELRPGLHLRPDNRIEGPAELKARLVDLGLEQETPVFSTGTLGSEQAEAEALWDTAEIASGYQRASERLRTARARLPTLPIDAAARELFVAGGGVIRLLVFDPLLPAPMVDPAARWALVEEMRSFDALGHQAWQAVLTLEEVAR